MRLAPLPLVRNASTALGTNNQALIRLPFFRYGTYLGCVLCAGYSDLYAVLPHTIFATFARLHSAYSADRIIYEDRHPIFD